MLAVVVAQLVERSLPIPEARGSNPVIGKNVLILNICLLSTVYWKDENKEKEAGDGPFKKLIVRVKLFKNLALSSLYVAATSLNFMPPFNFSIASRILDCFSHRMCWNQNLFSKRQLNKNPTDFAHSIEYKKTTVLNLSVATFDIQTRDQELGGGLQYSWSPV